MKKLVGEIGVQGKNLERKMDSIAAPNCLNTIRLIAAISVFYIHALAHLKADMPGTLTSVLSFFQGVPIFFAMSGFLVWNSVGRSGSFVSYIKKRFFRVYPELWCAVLLSLAMILLLYDEAIAWVQLGLFTITQGTVLQFWTPNFLRGYGCGTPNGALWTICVMVQFYVVIYFIHKLLNKKKLWVWGAVFVGAVGVAVISPLLSKMLPGVVYKLYRQTLFPHAWMFLLGVLLAAKRDVFFPYLQKYWGILLALSAVFLLSGFDVHLGDYGLFSCVFLIPGVIGLAYSFPKLNVRIDISYGIYIYHMIVINAMLALGFAEKRVHLVVALLLTCLLALISERVVGRAAMRLKVRK